MQIVNYLRARIFNSSYAALDLAIKNPKYSELAKNIVSIKQSSAIRDLIVSHSKENRYIKLAYKTNKYNFILNRLSLIEKRSSKATDPTLRDAFGGLLRLKVLRGNYNAHECCSPYNNKGGKVIITKADELLI